MSVNKINMDEITKRVIKRKKLKEIADKVGKLEKQTKMLRELCNDRNLQRNIAYRLITTEDKRGKTFRIYANEIKNSNSTLADWLGNTLNEIVQDITGTKALLIADFMDEMKKLKE